jgi:hypothetical protein
MISHRTVVLVALLAFVAPTFAQEAPRSPTPKEVPLPARETNVATGL